LSLLPLPLLLLQAASNSTQISVSTLLISFQQLARTHLLCSTRTVQSPSSLFPSHIYGPTAEVHPHRTGNTIGGVLGEKKGGNFFKGNLTHQQRNLNSLFRDLCRRLRSLPRWIHGSHAHCTISISRDNCYIHIFHRLWARSELIGNSGAPCVYYLSRPQALNKDVNSLSPE